MKSDRIRLSQKLSERSRELILQSRARITH